MVQELRNNEDVNNQDNLISYLTKNEYTAFWKGCIQNDAHQPTEAPRFQGSDQWPHLLIAISSSIYVKPACKMNLKMHHTLQIAP